VLTLSAATPKIVYGRSATLSGAVTQAGAGLTGQVVAVFAQPRGATAPVQVGTATTVTGGSWTLAVKPSKQTAYTATLAGAATPAAVSVLVKHRVTLRVKLKGRRVTFKGALGPKHKRRTVTIQRRSGTRWRKLASVKTTRRGTYTFAKRFAKGRFTFRAVTAKDADHLAGRSPRRKIRVR
jgi:hypothetical protein